MFYNVTALIKQCIYVSLDGCDELKAPKHGNVSCTNSSNAGSVCTFSCDEGYELTEGTTTRTCEESTASKKYDWSGSKAKCEGD